MSVRDRVLAQVYRLGYRGMRVWWAVRRPRLQGAKCAVLRDDQVLLVRHTYGDRDAWDIPGGRVNRDEEPLRAAIRELREETGLHIDALTPLEPLLVPIHGRIDTIHPFVGRLEASVPAELKLDRSELAEAAWFPLAALPQAITEHAQRILRMATAAT
jgi:8-oxo-dGTP pyrophosphatase MutT (NUDIX family)